MSNQLHMKKIVLFSLISLCFSTIFAQQKPNIVFILADDLGYSELGCYGQQLIKTPNLDKLSKEGMRFTQFYSNTLCAATRCSFVTGLDGAHAQVRDNFELGGFADEEEKGQYPLAENTVTIARELRKVGYKTALTGKWGLGGPGSTGIPNKQGFDFFYGYLDQKQAHNYYPSHLWRNEKAEWLQEYFSPHQRFTNDTTANPYDKYKGKIYAPDTITSEAMKFITTNKKDPFFLYLAYTLPHLALQVPDSELKQYEGMFDEKPYNGDKGYLPHPKPVSAYAAMISLLDKYVGKIISCLEENGIRDNTLIIFCSDNGATVPGTGGAATGFFKSNGDLRGYKGSLYEGGIREPFIANWKSVIKPGTTNNRVCSIWDMFASFSEISGIKKASPTNGISLLPVFKGNKTKEHNYLYWEVHSYDNGAQAVRWKNWKAIRKNLNSGTGTHIELYDLAADSAEKNDLSSQYPEIVLKMKKLMDKREPAVIKEWNFQQALK